MTDPGDITELLLDLDHDRGRAVDLLFPKVYDELRAVAGARLRAERAGHTLSATALVHEAYLKLVNQDRVNWQNRAQFFAIAARAMRRILMDYAAARGAQKRGGGAEMVTLGADSAGHDSRLEELLSIEEALQRLGAMDERQEKVVELRFFGGLKQEEIAEVLDISVASVDRDWRMARAYLTTVLER